MLCLAVAFLFVFVSNIQACPDPLTMVHIQNYDGPIIVHSATCDNQQCNPSNQYGNPSTQYCTPSNQYCPPSNQYCTPSNQYYTPSNQYCTPSNQYYTPSNQCCNPGKQCENECTCVSRNSYYPYNTQSGSYPATNYGSSNQYCKADDVKVYSMADGYSGYGNRCGNKNYQCQCVGCY